MDLNIINGALFWTPIIWYMNFHKRDSATKMEDMKNGQKAKNKEMYNLVLSKPENQNLRRKTSINFEFEFSRKNKHSLITDTKLQFDKVRKKWRQIQ